MWPVFENDKSKRRNSNTNSAGDSVLRRRPMKFAQLIEGMGDFSDLNKHDMAMKFWLPEPASEALEELVHLNGDSMSEALRQLFAVHCYGIYAYRVMMEAIPDLFRDPGSCKYSEVWNEAPTGKKRVDTYWVPELGKNVVPIKVWVPARMRRDLQSLADQVGIKLSQYVREIVISRLLGHGMLPMRPEMMSAYPLPSAEDWCEGHPVPMRQVSDTEYLQHKEREIRTEWVDV